MEFSFLQMLFICLLVLSILFWSTLIRYDVLMFSFKFFLLSKRISSSVCPRAPTWPNRAPSWSLSTWNYSIINYLIQLGTTHQLDQYCLLSRQQSRFRERMIGVLQQPCCRNCWAMQLLGYPVASCSHDLEFVQLDSPSTEDRIEVPACRLDDCWIAEGTLKLCLFLVC